MEEGQKDSIRHGTRNMEQETMNMGHGTWNMGRSGYKTPNATKRPMQQNAQCNKTPNATERPMSQCLRQFLGQALRLGWARVPSTAAS